MGSDLAPAVLPPAAIAYSYLRLSSKRQANREDRATYRDGFRRQIEMRDAYLSKNPHLTLDTRLNLHDIGLSGFTGENSSRDGHGKLAAFQREVDEGRIARGSYLLVESLDRMTRQQVYVAQHMLLGLVNAGIVVVSIVDKAEFRNDVDDATQLKNLIFSIMTMTRGHEESKLKAVRLTKTWEEKRRNAANQKLTARAPAWLRLVDGAFIEHEERAPIVRRILGELADGFGRDRIASGLNADRIPCWGHGREWHGGTVQKITDNRALIGEYQPHKLVHEARRGIMVPRRIPAGPVIPDYFPRVVDEELWDRARRVADRRRMRNAPNYGGRQGTRVNNLFGMVATCGMCDRPMNYRDRGPRSTPVLRCSGERAGTCANAYRYPYRDTEDAVLSWIAKVDLSAGAAGEVARLDDALKARVARREALRTEGEAIVTRIGRGNPFAEGPLARLTVEFEGMEAEIADLTARLSALREAGRSDERKAAIVVMVELTLRDAPTPEVFAARSRIRQILRDTVVHMRCQPDGRIEIDTLDGQRHLFRDGLWRHDGRWVPSALGLFGFHPPRSKAEEAQRAKWFNEEIKPV